MKRVKPLLLLFICLVVILVSTVSGSLIQTAGWTASITDLRDAKNAGTIERTNDAGEVKTYAVNGKVTSGILIVPKNATKEHPAPAIVFTHGVYNNREMQQQFAIEMARRGFVTLMLDREASGHNDDASGTSGDVLYSAAKYLYNLTDNNGNRIVDPEKIAVAGHSFAGMVIGGLFKLDNPAGAASTVKMEQTSRFGTSIVDVAIPEGVADDALKNGYHLGLISAACVAGCSSSSYVPGANVIAIGEIKGNSDDMYDACNTKTPVYVPIAKNTMTPVIFKQGVDGVYKPTATADGKLYYKKGDSFVAVDKNTDFNQNTQYYKYDTAANSNYWMQSKEAMKFVGIDPEANNGIVNGGIYDFDTDTLLAQPAKEYKYLTVGSQYQSIANQGKQLVTDGKHIRVYYEFAGIHQYCTFSRATAAQCVDFFYAAYGIPQGAKYIAPGNQTWWIKELLGGIAIIALFVLLIAFLKLALTTKFFESLKAAPAEIYTSEPIHKDPIKLIFYILTFALTGVFGAWFYCYKLDELWPSSLTKQLIVGAGTDGNYLAGIFTNLNYARWSEVWRFAYWGMICALFMVGLTLVFWFIKRIINMLRYPTNYRDYDENPFHAFRVRSFSNIVKTLILSALLIGAFYLIVFGVWKIFTVDFQIFTLNLRVFKFNRILSYLTYVPYFVIFWVVAHALGANYRTKDIPEWITVTLNVIAMVLVFMIMVGYGNAYYIKVGVVENNAVWKNFCYTYPLIPLNALAVIVGRGFYKRTGSAWLSGIVCGTLLAFIACANQCLGLGV